MIGIYKITSPTNKIYIGQSVDIERRFKEYKRLNCKKQTKLYFSLKKHGVENHVFEILEECSQDNLYIPRKNIINKIVSL
jgi:group I intron endonuclease